MTESPRHFNSKMRVQELVRKLGGTVLINTNERGDKEYKFQPIWSEKHRKWITYYADTLARMPGGAMVDFEVNLHYHNNPAHDAYRTAQLAKWFITVIGETPEGIDLWHKDVQLFKDEVAYRLKMQWPVMAIQN